MGAPPTGSKPQDLQFFTPSPSNIGIAQPGGFQGQPMAPMQVKPQGIVGGSIGGQFSQPMMPLQGNVGGSIGGSIGGPIGGTMGSMSGQFSQPASFGGSMQPGHFPMSSADDDFENEPPLLEELGINVEHIIARIQGVALFKKLDEDMLRDADLSGPLVICMALGMALLLAGKLQFGYIYGFAAGGSFGICLLINVMSQKGGIDLYRTMSILGYGLIPIVVLAFVGIFLSLKSTFGAILAPLCISWATATSSRFFATAIAMQEQRWLVAYPVGLVYTFFTLITIF